MMHMNRRRRLTPARVRRAETAASAASTAPVTETAGSSIAPVTETALDQLTQPPRREHLYGSTYLVRQSFEETTRQRGYYGEFARYRRRIAEHAIGGGQHQQRDDALRRAGYTPGEVLFPADYAQFPDIYGHIFISRNVFRDALCGWPQPSVHRGLAC